MKEDEIRPRDLHNKYLELSKKDAEKVFSDVDWQELHCPACRSENHHESFVKDNFPYHECGDCGSLFQSPRPPLSAFEEFYIDSKSSNFWAEEFFPKVAEIRREKIFAPRAQRVNSLLSERGLTKGALIDVGAGYGVFLEEVSKSSSLENFKAIEPSKSLAQTCRTKGYEVLEEVLENSQAWHESANAITCFEVIEHVHDPKLFVEGLRKLLLPGGIAIVSGLGVDGFDIQVLWERSKAISPPHHLNFLSVKGLQDLFMSAGFKKVEVQTPGELDVDIIENYFKEFSNDSDVPRFVKKLLEKGPQAKANFQKFLKDNQFSSHTWIIAEA